MAEDSDETKAAIVGGLIGGLIVAAISVPFIIYEYWKAKKTLEKLNFGSKGLEDTQKRTQELSAKVEANSQNFESLRQEISSTLKAHDTRIAGVEHTTAQTASVVNDTSDIIENFLRLQKA